MTHPRVRREDELRPRTSAVAAMVRALIALIVFGVVFVLFLTAPLALIVVVCLGLVVGDQLRRRAHRPARQTPAAPARTPRGPVGDVGAAFRFGGQVGEAE
jgi:hypothetical protein